MTGLRWGILATGGIAHAFASDLRTAGLDLRAVGSRTLESAEAFASTFAAPGADPVRAHGSYESLVSDPHIDIVYIATPHSHHRDNALLALAHGKHVLIEKAVTLTAAQAQEIQDAATTRGLLAMEAMWTRYLPHMLRIHEIIAEGTLGEIRAVHASHTQNLPQDAAHRLNDLALGGGALLDLGVYPVSFAHDVLGAPETITAVGRLTETGADAEVATIFTHVGGALSTTLSTMRAAGPNTAQILGSKARIEIDSVWYCPARFRVITTEGTVLEEYVPRVEGRGMQFQALHAEQVIASGQLDSQREPFSESVAIMATMDEVRRQIGVRYAGVDAPA